MHLNIKEMDMISDSNILTYHNRFMEHYLGLLKSIQGCLEEIPLTDRTSGDEALLLSISSSIKIRSASKATEIPSTPDEGHQQLCTHIHLMDEIRQTLIAASKDLPYENKRYEKLHQASQSIHQSPCNPANYSISEEKVVIVVLTHFEPTKCPSRLFHTPQQEFKKDAPEKPKETIPLTTNPLFRL